MPALLHAGPCRSPIRGAFRPEAPHQPVHAIGHGARRYERLAHSEDLRYSLGVSGSRPAVDREFCSRGPSHSVHGPESAIMATHKNEPLTCMDAEPPIGIEPMTYALREGRGVSSGVHVVTIGLAGRRPRSRRVHSDPGPLLANALAQSAPTSRRDGSALQGRTPVACAAKADGFTDRHGSMQCDRLYLAGWCSPDAAHPGSSPIYPARSESSSDGKDSRSRPHRWLFPRIQARPSRFHCSCYHRISKTAGPQEVHS